MTFHLQPCKHVEKVLTSKGEDIGAEEQEDPH